MSSYIFADPGPWARAPARMAALWCHPACYAHSVDNGSNRRVGKANLPEPRAPGRANPSQRAPWVPADRQVTNLRRQSGAATNRTPSAVVATSVPVPVSTPSRRGSWGMAPVAWWNLARTTHLGGRHGAHAGGSTPPKALGGRLQEGLFASGRRAPRGCHGARWPQAAHKVPSARHAARPGP
jgi:hypothetical protein